MTFRFLAVVIALLLVAWVPQLRGWRDWRWFAHWTRMCGNLHGAMRVLLVVAPPAIAVAVVGALLADDGWMALIWLIFSVLVLVYTLGPRYLDADIDAVVHADGLAEREAAAQHLRAHGDDDTAMPLESPALVEASVYSSLQRRFGVLFWFVVLGPGGAMLYRLAQRLRDTPDTDADSRGAARRFADTMDWPAAHLMVFAMALVSNFDAVIGTWRAWHQSPTRSPWTFETGFLGAVARAGVDADVEAGDEGVPDTADPLLELTDTKRLLWRVLLVWLAVLALLVLAGWTT